METSARALTETEWRVLLDIGAFDVGWIRMDAETLERLAAVGLVDLGPGKRPRLTWTGREFVELRLSGLFHMVGGPAQGAVP